MADPGGSNYYIHTLLNLSNGEWIRHSITDRENVCNRLPNYFLVRLFWSVDGIHR